MTSTLGFVEVASKNMLLIENQKQMVNKDLCHLAETNSDESYQPEYYGTPEQTDQILHEQDHSKRQLFMLPNDQ